MPSVRVFSRYILFSCYILPLFGYHLGPRSGPSREKDEIDLLLERVCGELPTGPDCGLLPPEQWTADVTYQVCDDLERDRESVKRIKTTHPGIGTERGNFLWDWGENEWDQAMGACAGPSNPQQYRPLVPIYTSCEPTEEHATTDHIECELTSEDPAACKLSFPDVNRPSKARFFTQEERGSQKSSGFMLIHWTTHMPWIYTIPARKLTKATTKEDEREAALKVYEEKLTTALANELKNAQVRGVTLIASFHSINPRRWSFFKDILTLLQDKVGHNNGYSLEIAGFALLRPGSSSQEVRLDCTRTATLPRLLVEGIRCDAYFYRDGEPNLPIWDYAQTMTDAARLRSARFSLAPGGKKGTKKRS
ncbi:hypothetical protein N7512_004139 [Penicillium capsulatum]|nr:hypothetical protein N7512_004139 [Penicillium capsulatum]